MAAGGGFKWLTQNVFRNRLHILNHMSVHRSRKTFVYACARAFFWLCVKASENVCVPVCQETIDDCAYFPTKQITHIFPQGPLSKQSTANLQWQHRFTQWDVASTLPDHVTPSSCLLIGCLEAGGWREEGGQWWRRDGMELAGSGHMRENKFLPDCHGDESTASRGRGGGAQADLL